MDVVLVRAATGHTGDTGDLEMEMPHPLGSSADVYCFADLVQDDSIYPFTIMSAERIDFQDSFSEGDIVYIDGADHHSIYSAEVAAPLIIDWLDR